MVSPAGQIRLKKVNQLAALENSGIFHNGEKGSYRIFCKVPDITSKTKC
jgi:hypothetical protein